jgi:hypothetical protein
MLSVVLLSMSSNEFVFKSFELCSLEVQRFLTTTTSQETRENCTYKLKLPYLLQLTPI